MADHSCPLVRLQQVAKLLRYFDEDGDGRLSRYEFGKLWLALAGTAGSKRSRFGPACKLASVSPKSGLDEKALQVFYGSGVADLSQHFAVFENIRQLPEEGRLRKQLINASKSSYAPKRIDAVVHLHCGTCLVLSHEPELFLLEDGVMKNLGIQPEWIARGAAAASIHGLLLLNEARRFRSVTVVRSAKIRRTNSGGRSPGVCLKVKRHFGGFPKEWGDMDENEDEGTWDACLCTAGELHIAALADEPLHEPAFLLPDELCDSDGDNQDGDSGDDDDTDEEDYAEEPPAVYPPLFRYRRLVASHGDKRINVCNVHHMANSISISPDGLSCCFQVNVADVIEEANRGDWFVCKLQAGAIPRKVSSGPFGRVSASPALFSPSGSSLVYQANHAASRPITQHMDLWLVSLRHEGAPEKVTPVSMQVDAFCWFQGREDALWLSTTAGCELRSFILWLPTRKLQQVEPPVAFECLPSWSPCNGKAIYPVESASDFEGIWDEAAGTTIQLPDWSQPFDDIFVEVVKWEGPCGTTTCGGLYYSSAFSGERVLLVWLHGGPTRSWPILRGNFSADDRMGEPNFTGLLRAGYLLFVPLYRGTLGFGDDWSMATIGSQGCRDGDLGDVLAGVDHLQKHRIQGCGKRAGIFGESYGGYLTIKSLTDPVASQVFQCGAAMYGYVSNRLMSLATADFTWETEFCTPVESSGVWGPTAHVSDCLDELGNITAPLLLLHGDEDDVCPLFHSQMAYQALRHRGVPSELAIYPGQGHGFAGDRVKLDVMWRVLQWFLKHLPPCQSLLG